MKEKEFVKGKAEALNIVSGYKKSEL